MPINILKEPLFHFLLLGGLLFAGYSWFGGQGRAASPDIVVTVGKIENLTAMFARTWQRPPTSSELDAIIQDFVREEVLYREGLAMGLDRDDTIIRRRIRQKLEFVADEMAASIEPTDDDLAAYLEANPDAFRIEPRYSFDQVYVNPDRHGDQVDGELERLQRVLQNSDADPASLGDRILLDTSYEQSSFSDVARWFGREFSAALQDLPVGNWEGPVRSGFGWHLVRIRKVKPGSVPGLGDVRDLVEREWAHAQLMRTREQFYQELVGQYQVTIESPLAGQTLDSPGLPRQ